jgi:phage tail sheath gpL-like
VDLPVIATNATTRVDLAAKWKGTSANGIFSEVAASSVSGGMAFAVTQLSGGAINPSVQTALDQIGSTWETMIVNCIEPGDATALDAISAFVEGRWGALARKPLVAFTADVQAAVGSATTIPNARTLDRANVQLVAPGSRDPRFVVAARQVARIVAMADSNPPHDYGSLPADGLAPGTDAQQWLYPDRDLAVKAGCCTVEVKDGVVMLGDVVTMYHPAGDALPAYRYVVDSVKLQNALYNFSLEFDSPEWSGAPLIPDGQPTVNASAKTPSAAVAAAAAITDILAEQAILADPKTTKAGIIAEIDASNPKRVNLRVPIKLAGNTNIISLDMLWSFNFVSSV